jgi:hypothetical protein
MTTEIVLNGCYGGFSLSVEAYNVLVNEKGYDEREIVTDSFYPDNEFFNIESEDYEAYRTHPDLIEVVKKLGRMANGDLSSLRIVEIPDEVVEKGYHINDYDGIETVHEYHWSG